MNKDADAQEMAHPWIEERGCMDTSFPETSDKWLVPCADKCVDAGGGVVGRADREFKKP